MDFVTGRKSVKWLMVGALVLLVAALIAQDDARLSGGLAIIGASILVLACAVCYKYCRCPKCGKVVFRKLFALKNCQLCGASLDGSGPDKKVKKKKLK